MVVGVIPARYASTRFPGKPLTDLHGQTMIERVWRAASNAAHVDEVIIATDDDRIATVARGLGAHVVMTSSDLPSGTDRCHAAVKQAGLAADIVVNIQGDEPLLPAELIDDLVIALRIGDADVATPISRLQNVSDLFDPNVVKVVLSASGHALYFSRSTVPYVRTVPTGEWLDHQRFWKHIGIYAFTMEALDRHVQLDVGDLERAESLEQLRLLEYGAAFRCVVTEATLVSVDTEADADRVRSYLSLNT